MNYELFSFLVWSSIIAFLLFLIIGIVVLFKKKRRSAIKWFGLTIGCLIFFVALFQFAYPETLLVEDQSTLTDSEEYNIVLQEDSFDIKQKTIKYSKEDNALLLQFETNLPDDTVLNMILNLYQPDTWKEYEAFNSYSVKLRQSGVGVTVDDGLISYTIDNSQFNELLVPNGMVDIKFEIPVSKEVNRFIIEQFPNSSDFEQEYSNLLTLDEESNSNYEIHSEWCNSEIKNAYNAEEIYAYYKKDPIPFKELEKNPSKYRDAPISYTGRILQINTEEVDNPDNFLLKNNSVIRLAVDGDLDQVVYVTVQDMNGMEGIVSDDTITVYGVMTGSKTYESVAGYEITIPSMDALIYEK